MWQLYSHYYHKTQLDSYLSAFTHEINYKSRCFGHQIYFCTSFVFWSLEPPYPIIVECGFIKNSEHRLSNQTAWVQILVPALLADFGQIT